MKIGLIGCGKQAAKHIAGLTKARNAEVLVCDIDESRARAVANQFGLEWTTAVDLVMDDSAVSAVAIATPTPTHADIIWRAIESGKHFFCEKPLCRDRAEGERIKNAVEEKKLIGLVGYVYRYSPVFEVGFKLAKPISQGHYTLGRPVTAMFRLGGRGGHEIWKHRREISGGAISEMMVHMLDLAIWYFGQVERVEIVARDLLRPERPIAGEIVTVDAEDFVLIKCHMANGVAVYLQADLVTPAFSQFAEVQYENGSFMGSIVGTYPSYVFANEKVGEYQSGMNALDFGRTNLFEQQMISFCEHVRSGTMPGRNSIDDSLRIIDAMNMIESKN